MAMSYMTAAVSTTYNTYIVFIAIGITAVVCLGVTFFSIQTKWDITGMGAYLCIFSLVVTVFGLVSIFISLYMRSSIMMTIYAGKYTLFRKCHPPLKGILPSCFQLSRRYDRRAHQHPILKSKIIDFVINANNFLIIMRNAFQYLMYSTQQIIGGRKVELSPEEYVYAALVLYVTGTAHG
uniref:Uncharacterized protein n=1 Tax=Timema shepardi TaxID=629360 RepID=A0A7R9G380_TIMSH|nr:unnamed protein product [Timema shepardi]